MCTFIKITITITLLLLTVFLYGQENTWQQVSPWRYPDGGRLHVSSGGQLYYTRPNEVYFLDDQGDTEFYLELNNGFELTSMVILSDNEFWLSTANSFDQPFLLKTKDKGASFEFFDMPNLFELMSTPKEVVIEEWDGITYSYYVLLDSGNKLPLITNSTIRYTVKGADSAMYFFGAKKLLKFDYSGDFASDRQFSFDIRDVEVLSDDNLFVVGNSDSIFRVNQFDLETSDIIIYQSDNGPVLPNFVNSIASYNDEIFVSSFQETKKSSDNGETWENFLPEYLSRERSFLRFIRMSEEKLVFRSIFGLEILDMESAEISQVNTYPWSRIIHIDQLSDTDLILVNEMWQTGFKEIWKSSDFGISWYKSSDWRHEWFWQDKFYIDFNAAGKAGYYSEQVDSLFLSDNSGEIWKSEQVPTTEELLDLSVTSGSTLILASTSAIHYKQWDSNTWANYQLDSLIEFVNFRQIHEGKSWVTAETTGKKSLLIYYFDGETFALVSTYSLAGAPKWSSTTDRYGNFFLLLGQELISISEENLEKSIHCEATKIGDILAIHTADSIFLRRNDTLYFATGGCLDLELVSVSIIPSIWSKYVPCFLNSDFEGVMIDQGKKLFYYGPELASDFYLSMTDGSSSNPYPEQLTIYPNPSYHLINFDERAVDYSKELYDINGQLLDTTLAQSMNILEYHSGLYIVVFRAPSGEIVDTQKVVIR